jgi:signal transduction histidine kinase
MGSERLRLLLGAVAWLGAGILFAAADGSARLLVAAGLLSMTGAAVAWPLTRARLAAPTALETAPPADVKRLAMLQAQLEHLPVAAWVQTSEPAHSAQLQSKQPHSIQPLSSRARRLIAPGGVRDRDALLQLLSNTDRSGPVVLDTERGSERWQLQRQPLTLDGQSQNLLVLTPLEKELESESLHAWRQLLQVLTHEIMNSLTPIKSLSETALGLLDEPQSAAELRIALDAIARRAESLAGFVHTYRKVNQWPAPTLAPVDLQALFTRLQQAVAHSWASRGGVVNFELSSPTLRLLADDGQLEQVLLSLIRNAEQATVDESTPRLWVQARHSRGGRLHISVRDNGPGVPAGLERQIFLPFFSTREGGHGIGLTVVRQLMYGMGGRVRHVRPIDSGAVFVLIF